MIACSITGKVSGDGGCGPDDLNCIDPAHQLDILSYLATLKRVPATTCDNNKALGAQSSGAAFACFDAEWRNLLSPCRKAASLGTPYADVLDDPQAAAARQLVDLAMVAAYAQHHCSSPTTLCLDRDGELFGAAKVLQKGDKVTVVVLSPYADDVGTASISVAGVKARDTLANTAPIKTTENKGGAKPGDVAVYVLASSVSDAIGEDVKGLRVTFLRIDHFTGKSHHRSIELSVDQGRYFVDFGLAVPFVVRGDRVLTTPSDVEETTAPRAALSAIIFPAGRAKGAIRVNGCASLGIQIGTDFDFTRSVDEKDYYLGGAWEPIAGFGVGIGLAFVRGQFIPRIAGMSPPIAHEDHYMLRPYFSVFLTPDFVTTARAAVTALQAN